MSGDAAVRTGTGARVILRDLVMLTKPRIISLLLVTTIAPMYVAGSPSWQLIVVVAIGGYLMAGGANAVNMYVDRDIDDRMARTRLRPIPSGRMAAPAVLAFGLALATAATWLLATVVNVLTAALALAGFYFYIFVYWTPPHFWALALLKQKDYTNAGVPMAPLVWGERETMNQMVWYTVLLIAVTVLPVAFGAFGITYLVAALGLGGWLLVGVWRVRRAADWTGPAWAVYKYSLLYLALLFVAMAVDQHVRG